MKVTAFTRSLLAARRWRRAMKAFGYEEVGEGGGRLWELYRGARYDHVIMEVAIDPDRKSVWVKICPKAGHHLASLATYSEIDGLRFDAHV